MTPLLRRYAPDECRPPGPHRRGWPLTGYPFAWSRCPNPRCEKGLVLGEWPNGDGGSVKGPGGRPCPDCQGAGSIKDLIRQLAGHRCVRCGHPFRVGVSGEWESPTASGPAPLRTPLPGVEDAIAERDLRVESATNWSDCDERCEHDGPIRFRVPVGDELTEWEAVPDNLGPRDLIVNERAIVQAAWRILTVHHLTEEKADCRWWNLAALCQRCHLEIQGRVNMAQVYAGEHTGWFKPYAAGYYAAAYLGEDLSREETMGRLDELLALERAA